MEQELEQAAKESAARLGIDSHVLAAVAIVESAGRALAAVNGKPEPVIRFEGHYFDRRLGGKQKAAARAAGLSSPLAGSVKNPASQTARWALLERAAAINREAAYESTSFGVGQVMGAHWKWLGYENVEDLVSEARSGLAGQIRLMERFIAKSGLADALRRQDWTAFARGYNGPGFARNGYDRKLEQTVARLKRHFNSGGAMPADPSREGSILRLGMTGTAVADMQQLLCASGFPIRIDGNFGKDTQAALLAFQKAAGLRCDGIYGPESRAALESAMPAALSLSRLANWLRQLWSRLF